MAFQQCITLSRQPFKQSCHTPFRRWSAEEDPVTIQWQSRLGAVDPGRFYGRSGRSGEHPFRACGGM